MFLLLGIVFASHAAWALGPLPSVPLLMEDETPVPPPSSDLPPPPHRSFSASLMGFTGQGYFGGSASGGWSPKLWRTLDFDLHLGVVAAQDEGGGMSWFPNGGIGLKVVIHEDGYVIAGTDLIFHPALSAGVYVGKTCFIEGRMIAVLDGDPQYLIGGLGFGVALPGR